jgi:hypothetical protein
MKRFLIAICLSLPLGAQVGMQAVVHSAAPVTAAGQSPVLVSQTSYGATNPGPHTSSAINCTGANELVVIVANYTGWAGTPHVADSSSNTWTQIFPSDLGYTNGEVALTNAFYVKGATVSAAQTVTIKGEYEAVSFSCWNFAADGSLDTKNSHVNQTSHTAPDQPGSVTPAAGNSLIIAWGAASYSSAMTFSVSSPTMTLLAQAGAAGTQEPQIGVWYVNNQNPAAAINPCIAATGGFYGNFPEITGIIVFKP